MTAVLPGLPTSIDRAAALRHARRSEFEFFALKALPELVPDLVDNWHLKALYALAGAFAEGDHRRVMLNIPPRGLKSVIFSSVLPAFLLGRDPSCRIMCVSYSRELAELFAAGTRRITRTPWYRELFPRAGLQRAALDRLATGMGGYRMATSIGGSVTGFGADVIIIDDPLKADDAYSEAVRSSTNDWVKNSLFSRLNDRKTGRIAVVAQRLHEDDLMGSLEAGGGWHVVSMPAVAVEPQRYDLGRGRFYDRPVGELLHEARLPQGELEQIRLDIGSRNYEAQYQQQPAPADGVMFKRDWLKAYEGPYVKQAGDRLFQSWDMANKTESGNDWSVCITAVQRRSQLLVLDVFRGRLAFPDLKRKVIALALEHRPYKLLIEDAAAGTQMIQTLQAEQVPGMPLPIAIKPDRDKISRADRAAARVESGALLLPEKAPWRDAFVTEVLSFPGRYDDQVDAVVQLVIYTEENRIPRLAVSPMVERADGTTIMNEVLRSRE